VPQPGLVVECLVGFSPERAQVFVVGQGHWMTEPTARPIR
jgi:hypothetical protein